jgi:signal transduction histidine kinase
MGSRVAAALAELAPAIEKTGATVTQPLSWPDVTGVPQWLETIWWNLLGNALKHGGPGVRIRIGWTLEADEYRFMVVDRGPGVSSATEKLLFQPFEQLHAMPTQGLGLSLVQRLVMLQGGRCGHERLRDGSSEFYFTLPAVAAARPARKSETAGPKPSGTPSVLANGSH